MPFIGSLDYASHLRFTPRLRMHRYSSILIPHSIYHFPVRIASMSDCYVFLRRMGVGLDGMTNEALPPRHPSAAVYGHNMVMILDTTK